MMAEPLPNRPGLWDAADWKLLQSVPDTMHATPHGAHWAALLRLFSWQIQRVAELEERLAKVEADLAPLPRLGPVSTAELRAVDLLATLIGELNRLDQLAALALATEAARYAGQLEELEAVALDVVDAINAHAPAGLRFGRQAVDPAWFGWWPL